MGSFALFTTVSCINNEEPAEVIVKDSLGITTGAPLTDHVDSAAADTIRTFPSPANEPVQPQEKTPVPAGVQTRIENYTSSSGEALVATYNNNEQMSLVTLEMSGEAPIRLMQTEAWAKGAEYSNGKIVWRAEGDAASFTRDGKTTQFSVKK